MGTPLSQVAIIAIGRNEGERLRRSLESLRGLDCTLVYVDSGSTDNSIEIAREAGADIVELDMSIPFSAARARNAGADKAMAGPTTPAYLQFIDGDCAVAAGWIDAGVAYLDAHPETVLVTGWRKEIHPDVSVYNAMCDVEWHRPAGKIATAGGDVMVRAAAHLEIGGYNPHLIAGEDPDYSLRLGTLGSCVRLPMDMTLHDASMTRFGQWWRRAVRAGHAYAHLEAMHKGQSKREIIRAIVYAVLLPVAGIGFLILWPLGLGMVLAIYAISYARTALGLMRNEGLALRTAAHHSVFLTLSKFPNLVGMATFALRRIRGRDMKIIEYK